LLSKGRNIPLLRYVRSPPNSPPFGPPLVVIYRDFSRFLLTSPSLLSFPRQKNSSRGIHPPSPAWMTISSFLQSLLSPFNGTLSSLPASLFHCVDRRSRPSFVLFVLTFPIWSHFPPKTALLGSFAPCHLPPLTDFISVELAIVFSSLSASALTYKNLIDWQPPRPVQCGRPPSPFFLIETFLVFFPRLFLIYLPTFLS